MLLVATTFARIRARGGGVPPEQRAAYQKHIGKLIGETADLADQAGKDAQSFLQQATLDIVDQLAKVRPGSWTQDRMGEIVTDIGRMAESMGVALDSELAAAQAAFAARGATEVLSGIREADIRTGSGATLAQAVARFPGIDSVVVNALGGFRSDLITVLAEDTRQAIAQRVALGIVTGQSQLETLQQIEALITAAPEGDASIFGTIWNRAYVIQVTEAGRAYSVAKRARGIQINEMFEGQLLHRWADVGDGRTRADHKEAGARPPIPFKQRFVVGAGKLRAELLYPRDPGGKGGRRAVAAQTIGCVASGTLVSGRVLGALRVGYEGELLEIRTARGYRLQVTGNHPVLTPDGFVPANAIQKGQHVLTHAVDVPQVRRSLRERLLSRHDVEHAPAAIEQVFDALREAGATRSKEASALDLHGDGVFAKGQIDVVRADRSLLGNRHTASAKPRGKFGLVCANARTVALAGLRLGLTLLGGRDASSRGAVSRGDLARALFRRHSLPSDPLRLGQAAHLDASRYEGAPQGCPRESGFAADLIQRYPGSVAVDEVVEVWKMQFRGHVYDLQTQGGFYAAGGILISNCRCAEQQELPESGKVLDRPASSPADSVERAVNQAEAGVEKLMSSAGARALPAAHHHGGHRWPANFLPSLRALLIRTPSPRPGPRPQPPRSATSSGGGAWV